MKKFKCSVCGYIHIGDEAPEICPVCKKDKTVFKEIKEKKNIWAYLSKFFMC